MEKLKNSLLEGKDEGIRFICKRHWWVSPIKPCKKCSDEMGISESDYKEAVKQARHKHFKQKESDSETPKSLLEIYKDTKLF